MSWSRYIGLLSRFFSLQFAVQAIGFVVGILIVRGLDKPDYALYTVGTSVVAALIAMSDGGVTSLLAVEGSKVREDRTAVGTWVWCSLRIRRWLGAIISIAGLGVVMLLMIRNGATVTNATIASAIVLASLWPALDRSIYQVPLRLNRDYLWNQIASLIGALIRLAAVGVLLFTRSLSMPSGLAIALLGAAVEMVIVRRRSRRYAVVTRPAPSFISETRPLFIRNMRLVLPASIVMVLQGQIYLVVLSFTSTPDILAELGALSRFSVIYTIFSALYLDVVSGRVARMRSTSTLVTRAITVALASYLAIVIAIVTALALCARLLLSLLGPEYFGLEGPLIIVAGGSGLIALGGAWRNLNQSRNWISGAWIFIPFTALWLLWGLFLLDLTNVNQAAFWMAGQALPSLVAQAICTLAGSRE